MSAGKPGIRPGTIRPACAWRARTGQREPLVGPFGGDSEYRELQFLGANVSPTSTMNFATASCCALDPGVLAWNRYVHKASSPLRSALPDWQPLICAECSAISE